MREPVALLTPRPSLRVPRREMIGEPSPATSSKLTAYPPARLHSQDTSGAGAVGMEPRSRGGGGFLSTPPVITDIGCVAAPRLSRSVLFAGVGSGGGHTSSYLGIQTCWVYV